MRSSSPSRRSTDFWQQSDVDQIAAALEDPAFVPDLACAQTLRDRAAAGVLADPQLSYAIATVLLRAVRRTERVLSAEILAVAWRCRAEASMFTGRLKAARQAYERACREAERGKQRSMLAQMLVGRVHLLSLLGDAAEADRLFRRAERLLKRIGDLVYLGRLYMNRGNAHYQQERYGEAYRLYRQASDVFERAGIRDAMWAGLIMNQAIACTNLSRVEEARTLFLRTERESERLGLDGLMAMARLNRAFLEGLRGDYRAALGLLERAEDVFGQHGSRDLLASARRSRAEIFLSLGMFAEGEELTRAAAEIFTHEEMAIDAALTRVDQARCLLGLGRPADADGLLHEAEGFFRQQGMRPRRAMTLLERARVAQAQNRLSAAGAFARRAHQAMERLGLLHGTATARRVRAELHLAQGRSNAARRVLEPAMRTIRRLPLAERFELWWLAGRVSLAAGRRGEAVTRLRRAARLLEDQRMLIPGIELRARAFERQVGVYHDLIRLALQAEHPRFAELHRLVGHGHSRTFGERLQGVRARLWDHIAEQRTLLGSLTHRLEELELAGRSAPDPRQVTELRGQVLAVEKEIIDRIRRVDAAEGDVSRWQGVPPPAQVEDRLASGEVLVQYYALGEQVLVLILGGRRRHLAVLPESAQAIRAHLEDMEFLLGATALHARRGSADGVLEYQRAAADHALYKLYEAVLHPVAEHLHAAERLLIVPSGWLHRLPFECLHDGHHYVNDRLEIVRCPNPDFLLRQAARPPVRRRNVIIAATVTNGPPFAQHEVETVAAQFPGRRTHVLCDPDSHALLARASTGRIVHISTHGAFRVDNPYFSRLSTADGAIFLADVLDARLDAELVVLSACESGQVQSAAGDDLSSVAHGFLAAGARCLVAARWRVHDEATHALIEAFYRRYARERISAARALREAQQAVRGRWDHPFYWAGFSVFGR